MNECEKDEKLIFSWVFRLLPLKRSLKILANVQMLGSDAVKTPSPSNKINLMVLIEETNFWQIFSKLTKIMT